MLADIDRTKADSDTADDCSGKLMLTQNEADSDAADAAMQR